MATRRRTRTTALVAAVALLFCVGGALAQEDVPEVARGLIDQADRHLAAGRLDEALAAYEQARALAPEVVAIYANLGAIHSRRGDYERALAAFVAGLERTPGDASLLYNAAVAALRLERLDAALDYAARGVDAAPRDAPLHALHGAVLRRLGDDERALPSLEAAVRLAPGDAQNHYRLGNLLYQLGRRDNAIGAYRKAIQRDKSFLPAHYNLGAVLFDEGRYDEALAAYLVALDPVESAFAAGEEVEASHGRAYRNLGAIHFHKRDWRAALAAYEKALRLEPGDRTALYNQGFIHFTLGDLDAAEAAYRQALALDGQLPLAYLHLGEIAQRRGRLEAAVDWFEQGLPVLTGDERAQLLRALAASRWALGRAAEAEEAYRTLLAERPDDVPARIELARIRRSGGDLAGARELLREARRVAPASTAAALELAAVERAAGDRAAERALYEELLRRGDDDPALWSVEVNLALLLLDEGAVAEAQERLQSVLQRAARGGRAGGSAAPDAASRKALATTHALVLARQGDTDEAAKRLRAVLREDPAFAPAAEVAALLATGDDPDAALAAARQAAARDPADPLAAANLGQLLWLAGHGAEARPALERAVAALADWPTLHAALGDLDLRAGDPAAAVPRLERAVTLCGARGDDPTALPPASRGARFAVAVGGVAAVCDLARRDLGAALVAEAAGALEGALANGSAGAAQRLLRPAERALGLPLAARDRAVAELARGSGRLLAGDARGARDDLAAALAGALPGELRPAAETNLGVALYRLGDVAAARARFEAVRGGRGAPPAATLDLAILLHDRAGDAAGALDLYRRYLAAGGARREVAEWVERLARVYGEAPR